MSADSQQPGRVDDRAVIGLVDRAAARTALPHWEVDLDAVVQRGTRRRRRAQAGLAGAMSLAVAGVVAVAVSLGGTGLEASPTPEVAGPGPVLNAEGYRGPATFDALSDRPGLCPVPTVDRLPDGRPEVVPTDLRTPLTTAFDRAAADAGLGVGPDTTVQRDQTYTNEPPCGPRYRVGGTVPEGVQSTNLTITWARGVDGLVCDGTPDCQYGRDADRGARWSLSLPGAPDGSGDRDWAGSLVVELVGDDPALLDDPSRRAPDTTATVVVDVFHGEWSAEQLLEVALAEDWHALAAQVEADVVATQPVDGEAAPEPSGEPSGGPSVQPPAAGGNGSDGCEEPSRYPVDPVDASPLVTALRDAVEAAGPTTSDRARVVRGSSAFYACAPVLLAELGTAGGEQVWLDVTWAGDVLEGTVCEAPGCTSTERDGIEVQVRSLGQPTVLVRRADDRPLAEQRAVVLSTSSGAGLSAAAMETIAVATDWHALLEEVVAADAARGACEPVAPRQLPSGAAPGDAQPSDDGRGLVWGRGADAVALVSGPYTASDLTAWALRLGPGDEQYTEVRGLPASLLPVGDPGQVQVLWEDGHCAYTAWVGDGSLTLAEVAEYARRW